MAYETQNFPVNARILGDLTVIGSLFPAQARSFLVQDDFAVYQVPWTAFRVWDAFGTNLPGTSAADDLGMTAGVFGTGVPYITTGDVKTLTVTRYARAVVDLPPEYVASQSVRLKISGGMKTTVADTSATVDVEVYQSNRDGVKTGSDLCATAAQSINSVTFADKNFEITATGLSPGDQLDIRITVAVVDAATGTAVEAALGAVELCLDIKG